MEATSMSLNRWMDGEVVVHTHNGILLSHKKERIWVGWTEVDEPRVYYTEWSKSEREKQILSLCVCVWNLEKWHSWTYLQGRNRDTDVESSLWMQPGKEMRGEWRAGVGTCASPCEDRQLVRSCWVAQGAQLSALWPPRKVRLQREGRHIHINTLMADPCFMAETNMPL